MLYEIDEQFLEELQKAQEENLLPNADGMEKEEILDRIKRRSYVIANKQAELKAIADLEKEIRQKKQTINNTIDFLKSADEKDLAYLCGDDIDKAKKLTKGFLTFRKSTSVSIPDELEQVLADEDIRLEKIDEETGEVIDVTEDYFSVTVNRKINKTDLKNELKYNTVNAVTKDGEEYKITLEEKNSMSIPKVII